MTTGFLRLEDGTSFEGQSFGLPQTVSGEVVFNTGMVGYPEALTDPSYRGQILALTYPLVGNYGVPQRCYKDGIDVAFESDQIQIAGLVISEVADDPSHWNAAKSLAAWLQESGVPGLCGVDTRALTKHLRQHGSLLGKLRTGSEDVQLHDPNQHNLVSQVSIPEPIVYPSGTPRVVVVDCGCKNSILRSLQARGVTVIRVPWNYDFLDEDYDGIVISNGPGDPKQCEPAVRHIQRAMERSTPIFGICLGHQILALAAGGDTYKLKFGHRGHNQPCSQIETSRCYITSQNHGYAVDAQSLPAGWEPLFSNANDSTNEGIRHTSQPFLSVQFHPEAAPGPVDTNFLFDQFVERLA